MTCAVCKDIEEVDGIGLDCETGEGCTVGLDGLGYEEQRALSLRRMLVTLKDLTGPQAVLQAHHADMEDLKLLAAIEEELAAMKEERQDYPARRDTIWGNE